MNLKSLEIPDRLDDTGAWLDDLLVSPDLAQTIAELEILAGDRLTTVQSLDGALAGAEGTVLESGLAGVKESVLRSLLRQPSLLVKLQERVMMHGGDYWQKKTDHAFGRTDAKTVLGAAGVNVGTEPSAQIPASRSTVSSKQASRWSQKQIIGAITAVAAALLVMFAIWQPFGQGNSVASANWGFAKSGMLTSDISEDEMLSQLASASNAWHNKRPESSGDLKQRLLEFDQGCEALLASNLPQLAAASRNAVHQACRDCRDDIATQLAAIDRGEDFGTIQSDANNAIDRLTRSIEGLI